LLPKTRRFLNGLQGLQGGLEPGNADFRGRLALAGLKFNAASGNRQTSSHIEAQESQRETRPEQRMSNSQERSSSLTGALG
jgi:hypothetical protein